MVWWQKSPLSLMMGLEGSLNGQAPCKKKHPKMCFIQIYAYVLLNYSKCALVGRYEVNETIGMLTLVAYRNKGTYGNVSLFFFAQNLEAQQGLDYNTSETVSSVKYSLLQTKFVISTCI